MGLVSFYMSQSSRPLPTLSPHLMMERTTSHLYLLRIVFHTFTAAPGAEMGRRGRGFGAIEHGGNPRTASIPNSTPS